MSSYVSDNIYRIMVVDDEPIVHRQLECFLSDSGMPVKLVATASFSEEALQMAGASQPHICLLDINLPGMNGLELGEKLIDILDRRPQIIYLTAYSRFDYAKQAIKLGAVDYLLKPVNRADLLEAIARAVGNLNTDKPHTPSDRQNSGNSLGASTPLSHRVDAVTEIVCKYVDANYQDKISLSSAADVVSLSSDYLGSLFRSATGVTFRSYLRCVRMNRAKELMKNQNLNLSQIAQAVGYPDLNYFSQAFLEETGVRPSEYRRGGHK